MMNIFNESLQLLLEKLQDWLNQIILIFPNLVVALVVFLLFIQISKLIRKFALKGLNQIMHNKVVSGLFASIVQFVVVCAGGFIALEILQLSKVVTSLLAGAGILGLAIGIAFQDFVETADVFGKVKKMGLRSTVLETTKGQIIFIPNKLIFENPLINYSKKKTRRVDLSCGVSYDDDLVKVQKVAIEAIESLAMVLKKPEVTLIYKEFGDSSINFTIRFWVEYGKQHDFNYARSEAIMAMKKAFDTNEISIPFPIQTLEAGNSLTKTLKTSKK